MSITNVLPDLRENTLGRDALLKNRVQKTTAMCYNLPDTRFNLIGAFSPADYSEWLT